MRVWGHGYVLRYFDGYSEGLWLKRYRCADCGAVHTLRPQSHSRGFWASISSILESIIGKVLTGSWNRGISYQRQQYWLAGFIRQASRRGNFIEVSPELVLEFILQGIILSTHSLRYFEIKPFRVAPHLMFAVTGPSDYG